ncbi:hypothetical protein P280DRAFT_523157 [Massarina eburnea CBS 473.64]|uniref:Uncharacterized protein n=1 Tax=Massarina eburnea CBS 473.64 TaxID=1395130 RepID=A0A6A6RJR7_9PLEO|nr:hypothetical protein P280DRAFT_523157 [Massarina eburnea CBS 473.64]
MALMKLKRNSEKGTFNAWKEQGLKALWNDYMNEKFATAKERCSYDLDTYLPLLLDEWQPSGASKTPPDSPKKIARAKPTPAVNPGPASQPSPVSSPSGDKSSNDHIVLYAQIRKIKAAWDAERAKSSDAPW